VTGDSLTEQDRARGRLTTARDHVRRRRGEVMLEVGHLLRIWRDLSGILQQDLAAEGCVSATVVRRIEKGDYESAPPESLIAAVSRLGGPARELAGLARTYQDLQGQQRQIDKLLIRKVLPATVAGRAGTGERITLGAGLRPAATPRPPSVFVGRQRELSTLTRMLDRQRLVTVVGPGGIGKTALCLRLAQACPPELAGPWFADLSRVRAGEPLLPLLARLILDDGDAAAADDDDGSRFGAALGGAPALVIFDNCEHVLADAADAATRLLDVCPEIRILATSREPLHLPDESVLTIGPLPVPEPERAAAGPADAVELFTRLLGTDIGDGAGLNAEQSAAVTDLCRQLDGIPLCIVLAAARARTLPLSDVAASVRRGLAVLSGGRRDIPRHQAIEATISWSWDLLTQDEQRALARLAILGAPFTLLCGATVAAEDTGSGDHLVAALADKSLLSQETNEAGGARLKILAVVRNFALTRLTATDRQRAIRQLMSWALATTPADEIALQQSAVIERLDTDFPLIRAALELSEDAPADQVRLALAIWQYWHIRSLPEYGCRFLAKARDESVPLSPLERGKALGTLASLLAYQGHFAESIDAARLSIEVWRALGDPAQLRYGLLILFGSLLETREFDEAERCLTEIAEIPGEIDRSTLGDLRFRHGVLSLHRGDPQRAVRLLREAAHCFSGEKMTLAHGFCLGYLSVAYRRAGDLDASLASALQARQIVGGVFGPSCEAEVTVGVAAAYLALGRPQDALAALDAAPLDEQVRSGTRTHALALRAMAASAVSPSAAAAFLLSHAGEFADGFAGGRGSGEDQVVLLVGAVQEIAYRSQGYETAARLLGVRARLRLGDQKIDIGPPARESSSRLAGRVSQPRLEALIAEGAQLEPGNAIDFTVAVLTQLAAAAEPRGPVLGTSTTAGTRLMIIAPYSAPQRRSS
jgi:predicted ATPase/transcriptional regulator with XRE-family HTH domain